jgi:hypothetical protein
MGRRAHRPDQGQRRQVEAMAAYGIPESEIAGVLSLDPKTLRKHYRAELDLGETKANAQVAGFLFSAARNGNVTAQIFWLKTRARWRETPLELRHSGTIGHKNIHELSDEELIALIHNAGQPFAADAAGQLLDSNAHFLEHDGEPADEEAAPPS